tara:strand:- start:3978 stop:13769 length:9792 start_codon:yes stop_codon:yes gene_type:complete
MAKKQFTLDPRTDKLSRLSEQHLPFVQLNESLNEGDPVAPFGTLTTDIIEYCLYDLNDNYLASAQIRSPLPEKLNPGKHIKDLGYERGTYKIVYNFLREIGGSDKLLLIKQSDRSIWEGQYFIETDGDIFAGTPESPIVENGERIQLSVEDDKYFLQDISGDRTEVRLRPNPAVNDPDANERFRLLGYTCLCQADVAGESPLSFDDTGKKVTVNWVLNEGQEVSLNELMKGGTLIIRDAFVIDYAENPEVITNMIPVQETTSVLASENIVKNGHFDSGEGVLQENNSVPAFEVVEFPNPGNSKWCLELSPEAGNGGTNDVKYEMTFDVIPGETYVLSCWVHHDENWNGRTDAHFSAKAFVDTLTGPTIVGMGTILDTKVVDGKTWEYQYSRISVPATATGKLTWYLGAGVEHIQEEELDPAEIAQIPPLVGSKYYTNLQCEPGSPTSLPTPYMTEERPEEIEVQSSGQATFIDDKTISANFTGDEDGFIDLMTSDGGDREAGKITIKDGIVVDENFDIQIDRTIIDDIPVDNPDASVVRDGGEPTEFNKSPFHNSELTDSTDLNITLQANDIYRLNKVNPDGTEEEIGRYDLPVDVSVVDEIPIESSMAPEIEIEEKNLHRSTFHGEIDNDSNELIATIHSNDIYRLYRIGSDGTEELVGEYNIPEEVKEVDDLELSNPNAAEIRDKRDAGEWYATQSPYHNTTQNKIILQVDDEYTLYRLTPGGEEIEIGSHTKWKESKEWSLDTLEPGDRLRIVTTNKGGRNGFIAKVYYNNQIYRTGDTSERFQADDDQETSITSDGIWDATAFQYIRRAAWWAFWRDDENVWWDMTDVFGAEAFLPTKSYGFPKKNKFWKDAVSNKELEDCQVIWTGPNFRRVRWEWEPASGIYTKIWKHADPSLNVRSVHPEDWSSGLSHYNWGTSADFDHWRTGWLGHQAKWVQGEGQGGGPAMKFVDQNSKFQNPNHPGYNGRFFDEDGNRLSDYTSGYAYGNKSGFGNSGHPTTLIHRWQGIDQRPPFSFESQGIKVGDKLKISWWQKSDTIGKGARVHIRYWVKGADVNAPFWSSATTRGNTDKFIPVSKEGEWEKAEYIFEVQEDWDLARMGSSIYGSRNIGPLFRVEGHYGPEGILWVSEPKITLVSDVDNPEVENTFIIDDFQPTDKLKLYTTNLGTEPRGFLAKINYKGKEYRTGDKDKEYYFDDYANRSLTVDLPGTWEIIESENKNWVDLGEVTEQYMDPELKDSKWIWSSEDVNDVVWQWLPNNNIQDGIWNYPDPILYEDAVSVPGWTDGFNPFHWGGRVDKQNELFWHSGWVGHHAKWVRDEGQFGTCMKFIDMNSQFLSPNHEDYDGLYKTGNNTGTEGTLAHREQAIRALLPNKLSSQGIVEGSFIRISWWQKTNIEGKGAKIGILHQNKDGTIGWGENNEFYRMIPCTSVDEWEQVNYTGIVDENWDLDKDSTVVVKGNFGPEGILWVEDVKVEIVSGVGGDSEQVNTYTAYNFTTDHKLKLYTTNLGTQPAGFISKIDYRGAVYKTGDPGVDFYTNPITDETITVNLPGVWKVPGSNWKTLGKSEDINPDLVVDPILSDSVWIGNVDDVEGQQLWEWNPLGDVGDYIWNYPDPSLRTDAIWPEFWSNGFFNFDFDDTNDNYWHTGWVGHHGKWVDGDGRDGEACMKFIDQNSQFDSPNNQYYTGDYKTGNSSADNQTLQHRPMTLLQKLPHTMAAQGVLPNNQLTISWRHKSDVIGKGARIGIRYYDKEGNIGFGEVGENPYTNIENVPNDREWLKYVATTTDDWEDASFSTIVTEEFDLTKPVWLVVYGHYGPEGILWVESPQIQITDDKQKISVIPVFGDFVAEVDEVLDKNTLTIKEGYDIVSETLNHVATNNANIRSWSVFNNFNVEYTSSIFTSEPVYGSLRGEIDFVDGDDITLVKTFDELALEANHDLENYPLSDLQNDFTFDKWFIQYPTDSTENLSKLVRLGPDNYKVIVNFKPDIVNYPDYPHAISYKLYEPLPDGFEQGSFVNVVREMIPPIEEIIEIVPFIDEWVSETVLRTPEFNSVNSPIGNKTTEWKDYEKLASSNTALKEELENKLISGSLSADINVDYSDYSNFVHFSSIEKRLKNFKHKLELIEEYTDRSASLAGLGSGSTGVVPIVANPNNGSYLQVSGSSTGNPAFTPISGSLSQIQSWERKRRETINTFDKYERYLWNDSSSYSTPSYGNIYSNAWPKRGGSGTYLDPYVLARTTQSLATSWYDEQIASASKYDSENRNLLRGHLPTFVQDDSNNETFLTFVDMMGHHFDNIWIFVKSITDVHDKRDKVSEGMSRDLLKPVAQSLGWHLEDGADTISLPRYILGMEQTGSEDPWKYSDMSARDISREIWSRIVNNMPYFLKTKGTVRSVRGLISCYGIPSSILRVMEYGGPRLPELPQAYQKIRRFTKALDFYGSTNNTYVQTNSWFPVTSGSATNRVPDTVEFRFKAASGSDQVLVRRGDDWAITLLDNGSSDRYGRVSFKLSGSHGYNEVSSSELPVFDGEFWSVMLTRELSGSRADGIQYLTSDFSGSDVIYSLHTKQYDAGRSRIVYESSDTLMISGSQSVVSASYNLAYSGSGTTITLGGPEGTYFGESFSGSMMEYRNWSTPLNTGSFDNHVAAPIAFDGNTPSASYLDLVTRYSFDDDKDLSVSANQWFQDATGDQSFTASASPSGYTTALRNSRDTHFSSVVDEAKMKTPNLGPSVKASNKLRIENDELLDKAQQDNPVLRFKESATVPAYDKAPIDSNKLGVYFSPSKGIDEDIISSMPNLDFDQYIGDPRDQYNEQYTGLVEARNLYWQKYSGPNNFWDYLRLLKYYDNSLYKQIKSLLPARANANVGIIIEPTILERDKVIIGKKPDFEPRHWESGIDIYYVSESARYTPLESEINYSHPFNPSSLTDKSGSYISQSAEYTPLESNLNYSHPFRVNFRTQESGSAISASSEYVPLESNLNYSHPFRVNFHTQESGSYLSASSEYIPLDSDINYGHPFRVNYHTQETGSFISASSEYIPLDSLMSYTDPFRVNSHTRESGSYFSASAVYQDIAAKFNLYNPYQLNNTIQQSGSMVSMSADFSSIKAPSDTLAANAAGTGSFVMKHILERPSLFNIGSRDESGWYGSEYYNATIQLGSQKSIFEEVVMPRIDTNVTSEYNREVEYFYSSSVSASLGIYYSSSFVHTDLDNKWDEALGTDRLFYLGCTNNDNTTVADEGRRYKDSSPVVEVTITSPTRLVTTDSPSTPLDVQ